MNQHPTIKTFYEEELKQFLIETDFSQGITAFKPTCLIGEARLTFDEEQSVYSSIDHTQSVPETVLSAFERHIWYTQHSASNISVLKIIIGHWPTFALCIHGYVDDGWDNYGDFIEVYDAQGELVGSLILQTIEDGTWESWVWLNRPIQGSDFNTPSPEPEQINYIAQQQKSASEQLDDSLLMQPTFISTYQPPNPIIYVNNLEAAITEKDVTDLLSGYGIVKQTVLVKKSEIENVAIVEMIQADQAKTAIAELNGARWRGVTLTMRFIDHEQKSSSLL